MQVENKEIKTVHPEKGMNGRDDSGGSKPNARDSPVVSGGDGWSSDSFYEKLSKFYESSGLSLVWVLHAYMILLCICMYLCCLVGEKMWEKESKKNKLNDRRTKSNV